MELTIDFLKDIALRISDKIHPLIGTKEAANKFQKGAGGDLSMQIDLLAEQTLIDILEQNGIDILLISEEIGEKYIGNKDKAIENKNILIVDPVDGSNNAVRGIPYCSISIAYAIGKYVSDIIKAVVLDLSTKDLYWAVKGKGSFFNDKKIHTSNLDLYDNCFIELNLSKKDIFLQLEKL
jgi:myo-inositol-1(or 4)-monophosphatase